MSVVAGQGIAADDTVEDAALARRIGEGDANAELELCRRLLPRVRAWGLKHTRDDDAARDLVQQVLVVVIEALRANRVENVDRVTAFVIGTCKHVLHSARRGTRRRADLLERFGPALAAVVEPPRDHGIDRRRLASCLSKLAPRARVVLALSFFAERETEEIAAELGVSTGNVRVLRHRALADLHACMEGE
jgi:RNA polymerase sigma-70 factor (ECF subfamily)